MSIKNTNSIKQIFVLSVFLLIFFSANSNANEKAELKNILNKIENISKDLKTLEKAFYKTSEIQTKKTSSDGLNEDVLTRHLLKLNEIEEQFREVTNRYEEINFKIDKLSNRITKMQSDNQLRFSDLENSNMPSDNKTKKITKKRLPGTDLPKNLGSLSDADLENANDVQKTQSIESAGLVVSEKADRAKSLLPNKPPKE